MSPVVLKKHKIHHIFNDRFNVNQIFFLVFKNFLDTDGKLDETKVLHHTSCTNSRLSPKLALVEYHSG